MLNYGAISPPNFFARVIPLTLLSLLKKLDDKKIHLLIIRF